MNLTATKLPDTNDRPVHRAARRMRWFIDAFSQQVIELSAETGVEYEINSEKLRHVFLSWVKAFEAQKPHESGQKKNYVTFAAGIMLRELIKENPISVVRVPDKANKTNPAYFWPAGYVYVAFCLNVRSAVIAQDFDFETSVAPSFEKIGIWWSFKENAVDDINTSIGFFELFSGEDPKWNSPQLFSSTHAEENVLRYYVQGTKAVSIEAG